MKKFKRVKLGEVGVDSGQLFLIDPCYLQDWKHGSFIDNDNSNHYSEVCNVTSTEKNCGLALNNLGFAFSTTYGDGIYSIYGYVDTKNNIHKLEILMGDCNEEETEENEETTDQ